MSLDTVNLDRVVIAQAASKLDHLVLIRLARRRRVSDTLAALLLKSESLHVLRDEPLLVALVVIVGRPPLERPLPVCKVIRTTRSTECPRLCVRPRRRRPPQSRQRPRIITPPATASSITFRSRRRRRRRCRSASSFPPQDTDAHRLPRCERAFDANNSSRQEPTAVAAPAAVAFAAGQGPVGAFVDKDGSSRGQAVQDPEPPRRQGRDFGREESVGRVRFVDC